MLTGAFMLKNSEYSGGEWYELKDPDTENIRHKSFISYSSIPICSRYNTKVFFWER